MLDNWFDGLPFKYLGYLPEGNETYWFDGLPADVLTLSGPAPADIHELVSTSGTEPFTAIEFGYFETISVTVTELFTAEYIPGYLDEAVSVSIAEKMAAGVLVQRNTGLPQLFAARQPQIKGGTALTAKGDAVYQAIYWELVSYDPTTGIEGPALGSLKYDKTKTDGAMLAINYYFSPTNPADAGKTDRVKAFLAHA